MEESQDIYPTMILFVAQLIGGVGGSVYYSLGVTYMDDNIQKSKTPVLISGYSSLRGDFKSNVLNEFMHNF